MLVTKRIVHASSSLPKHVRSLATAVATDPSSSTAASSSTSARRFPKLDDGLTLADFASGEPLEDRVTLGNTQQCVDWAFALGYHIADLPDLVCLRS